jgi:uncharacterized protein (TIGR03118 family)
MNHKKGPSWLIRGVASLAVVGALLFLARPAAAAGYVPINLVSNIPGLAKVTDPNLKNPWGISHSGTSPFWVSDNATGLATLYNGAGTPNALVITIPPAGAATPTGQVFNSASGSGAFNRDLFIFAAEDGTIAGWRGALGTTAETLVLASDAVYKGLAQASIGSHSYLYAANFHSGAIDVFPGDAGAPSLTGNFLDPNLPAGYAPFGIQNLNGKIYVTYAMQDAAKHDDVPGAGHGFVDVFDTNGVLQTRLISRDPLNSPWGLALAPANFGEFSNDLLVGNFGDGTINAFDLTPGPNLGKFLGSMTDKMGNPIVIDGLWGLIFGNGGDGGNPDTLYFTAGLNGETDGLFGSLAVPVPPALILFGSGLIGLLTFSRAKREGV